MEMGAWGMKWMGFVGDHLLAIA
eukprot:COSAG02_NODE_44245_length_368_cov_0.498141_1_plen_22_part_10